MNHKEIYSILTGEARRLHLPRRYKTDLTHHDKTFIRTMEPQEFIWILRDSGSHLYSDQLAAMTAEGLRAMRDAMQYHRRPTQEETHIYYFCADWIKPLKELDARTCEEQLTIAARRLEMRAALHVGTVETDRYNQARPRTDAYYFIDVDHAVKYAQEYLLRIDPEATGERLKLNDERARMKKEIKKYKSTQTDIYFVYRGLTGANYYAVEELTAPVNPLKK